MRPNTVPDLEWIHTGGQTGADLGALRAGYALGVPTGGWMPRYFKNELGERTWMERQFGMRMHASPQYIPRTVANLNDADAVVLFGNLFSSGSARTIGSGLARGMRVEQNLSSVDLHDWVAEIYHALGRPVRLMVAGNRESHNRGIEAVTFHRIVRAWNLTIAAPLPDWDVAVRNHSGLDAINKERQR